jgi:hypothetical protein
VSAGDDMVAANSNGGGGSSSNGGGGGGGGCKPKGVRKRTVFGLNHVPSVARAPLFCRSAPNMSDSELGPQLSTVRVNGRQPWHPLGRQATLLWRARLTVQRSKRYPTKAQATALRAQRCSS